MRPGTDPGTDSGLNPGMDTGMRHGTDPGTDGWAALLRRAETRLAEAGVPSPRWDAEELAALVIGSGRGAALARVAAGAAAGQLDAERFEALVAERARRVPLQHLTGCAGFRTIELAVGPGVFVPRPETELVAEVGILEARRLVEGGRPAVVVDLGTGSGAIAAAVAAEVPGAVVHAVEGSAPAYAWAQRNLAGRGVTLRLGDLGEAFPELDGCVDVVVSNPPYVPTDAVPCEPEVAQHDPFEALYGGPDGLDVVRAVIARAAILLRPGGLLVVEHAQTQGRAVPDLLRRAGGWREVLDHPDLTGRARFSTARKEGQPR